MVLNGGVGSDVAKAADLVELLQANEGEAVDTVVAGQEPLFLDLLTEALFVFRGEVEGSIKTGEVPTAGGHDDETLEVND